MVRPCVALLHSYDEKTGVNEDPEVSLIPRLDAREVAAVFTAPFHNFLKQEDEVLTGSGGEAVEGQAGSARPGEWYSGAWTEWHQSNWRSKFVHLFVDCVSRMTSCNGSLPLWFSHYFSVHTIPPIRLTLAQCTSSLSPYGTNPSPNPNRATKRPRKSTQSTNFRRTNTSAKRRVSQPRDSGFME